MKTLAEKFTEKVGPPEPGAGCRLWQGYTRPAKAPVLHDPERRRAISVHRLAWELEHGAIPDRMHVLHRCDNPHCVEVAHLFLGTHQDNMRDRNAKGRCVRGAEHGHAALTTEQVQEIRRLASSVQQKTLAARFGVAKETISQIVRRTRWIYAA